MTEGGRGSGSLSLGLGIDSPQWGLSGGIMLSQPLHNLCQCSAGIKCFSVYVCVWLPPCVCVVFILQFLTCTCVCLCAINVQKTK